MSGFFEVGEDGVSANYIEPPHGTVPGSGGMSGIQAVNAVRALDRKVEHLQERMMRLECMVLELREILRKHTEWLD